ncbi:MAG: sigma-70 family RNA polymerase sigma factor [Candidatus Hydrogenedentota bacterium]|nr:MAG: sigma-70 family RNA polymerase sigma factor [Candidatus Hydrogenedentota bacterium]
MPKDIEGLSDESLFVRICQGEEELYRILFDRYKRPLARLIARMTGRTDDLEDLVADVFLIAYQKKSQYRQSGSLKSWLYRIATNRARQYLRRQRFRRRAMTDLFAANELIHSSGNPSANELERQESKKLVMEFLSKMRPKLREVFVLRDLEELSYEEIAGIVDCPVGTVKSRLNAARKMMLKLAKESLNSREA